MNTTRHSLKRAAMSLASAAGRAGTPWVGSFASSGGNADGGFGLVVVDQGNPRHHAVATIRVALAH
jgi:hypothetical protein